VPWTKSVPPQLKAKSWHVKEYLGFVMIWYDSEKNPPSFDLPESISEQISNMYFVTHKGPYAVKMHIQEFAENSADFQHFGAIHNQMQIPFTTRRLPFITLKHNVDWKIGQGDNSHILNFYDTAWLKLLGKEFPSTKATATITMIGPAALAVFEFDVPKVGRAIVVMAHTPIDSLCMNVEFYAYAEKSVSRVMAWYLLGNWIAQWKNDISIWENKLYLHKPNVLQGDGPVKKLRRWFLQFYPKNYASRSIDCEIDS
jgi:cholesterol 7-dehydrogenase